MFERTEDGKIFTTDFKKCFITINFNALTINVVLFFYLHHFTSAHMVSILTFPTLN